MVDTFLSILFFIILIQVFAFLVFLFIDTMCGTHTLKWFFSLYRGDK